MSLIKEDRRALSLKVLPISQPIGDFFIGVLPSDQLCEITDFDVRRLVGERGFETYLGIQRPLDSKRVKQIQQYVQTKDACFPAGVILSVASRCASYNEADGSLELHNFFDEENPGEDVHYRAIAKVIDGQHRIEGLKRYVGPIFQVGVSIFIGIDVAEEGYVFSTVNLAQTKVNRSLATDLYELATTDSPQKLCHNVAVTLDEEEGSPFYHRIKRLGVATQGRFDETLTQATVYDMLMPYLSKDPVKDRDLYLRGKKAEKASSLESRKLIFRNMFIEGQELEIVDIIWNYFDAVRLCWPEAWNSNRRGNILNKTNGFRALMRFLRLAYLAVVQKIGDVPTAEQFKRIFDRMDLNPDEFNSELYLPGTGGEAHLFRVFKEASGLEALAKS
jgi:DGQHR domain-containing protein